MYMMYTVTSQELRRIRKAMGLTQKQLAEKLGVTLTSVARMERGEQRIMPVTTLAVKYLLVMESKKKGKKK
jgi:transcriptional regulator with XRE-family HTH domain